MIELHSFVHSDSIPYLHVYTQVCIFLGNEEVRERAWSAQTERGNSRGGATKKREISRSSLTINLHFSVHPN